ncbi:MAG: SycD/LcrH family type III secretion system chaperone [Pseudomonadota bacterium]
MENAIDIDEATLLEAIEGMEPLADGLSNEELVKISMALLKGEMQLKHVKGLTDEEMEAVYAQGYSLFRSGNYPKAEEVFTFLATFDNAERKYWTALGAVRFNQKNYDGAVMAYAQAAILNVDADLLVKVAQCHLGIGERETARDALEAAVEFAGEDEGQAPLKARAEAMLGLLDQAA